MKRVLIVIDVDGWAWDRMARGIQKYAPDHIEVDVVNQIEFGKFNANAESLAKYDGICQCSWVEATTGLQFDGKTTTWVASHGLEFDYPFAETSYYPPRIATQLRNRSFAKARLPCFDGLLCVSERLREIAGEFHDNCVRVVPGVDREVFVRREFKPLSDPPIIGWCGQKLGRTKGYSEVLKPLMDRMSDSVEWKINSRGAGDCLSQQEMVEWYHSLDLFLSTSFSEGCQMTVLEAISCGVPVIGTDSGCLRECVSESQLVPAYNDSLTAKGAVNHLEELLMNGSFGTVDIYAPYFDWKTRALEWLEAML